MAARAGVWVILISPVNVFGSGMIMVPSVPVISTTPVLRYGESKLNTLWLTPPPSNWAIALTWVGTSTGNSVSSRSPTRTVRVARPCDPTAATVATEPKTWTRVVR